MIDKVMTLQHNKYKTKLQKSNIHFTANPWTLIRSWFEKNNASHFNTLPRRNLGINRKVVCCSVRREVCCMRLANSQPRGFRNFLGSIELTCNLASFPLTPGCKDCNFLRCLIRQIIPLMVLAVLQIVVLHNFVGQDLFDLDEIVLKDCSPVCDHERGVLYERKWPPGTGLFSNATSTSDSLT